MTNGEIAKVLQEFVLEPIDAETTKKIEARIPGGAVHWDLRVKMKDGREVTVQAN